MCWPASTCPTRAAPIRSAWPPRWPRRAKALGARIVQGVTVTGVETERGRVTAVNTDQGRIETEVVVNAAAGMGPPTRRARRRVHPPQAAEHYYLITDTVPGMAHDLAVIEDPDRYGYYRPEGDGMLVGLFEPVGAPWSLDGVPDDFAFGTLPPDWDRLGPYLDAALARIRRCPRSGSGCSSAARVLHPGHPPDARAAPGTRRLPWPRA